MTFQYEERKGKRFDIVVWDNHDLRCFVVKVNCLAELSTRAMMQIVSHKEAGIPSLHRPKR